MAYLTPLLYNSLVQFVDGNKGNYRLLQDINCASSAE